METTVYPFSELEQSPLLLLPGVMVSFTDEGLYALAGKDATGGYIVSATAPIREIRDRPENAETWGAFHAITLVEGDYFSCRNECFQICDGMLVPTSRAAADVAVLANKHPDQPVVVEDMAFYGCTDILPQALEPGLVFLDQEPVSLGGYSFAVDPVAPYHHPHVLSIRHVSHAHPRTEPDYVKNFPYRSEFRDINRIDIFDEVRHYSQQDQAVCCYSLADHTINPLITEANVWRFVPNGRSSFMERGDSLFAQIARDEETKRDARIQLDNYRDYHKKYVWDPRGYFLMWSSDVKLEVITAHCELFCGEIKAGRLCDGTMFYRVDTSTQSVSTLFVHPESAPLTFYPECVPYARFENNAALYLLPEGTLVLQADTLLHTVLVSPPF